MKTESKPSAPPANRETGGIVTGPKRPLLWTIIILVAILAMMFHDSLRSGFVVFSNDGPLGAMMQELNRMPSALKGLWLDLNWLGSESISPPLSIASALRLVTSPMVYDKILCPTAILMAGLGACFCFRRLKLSPWACVLGALAAAMNSDFFSTSCWGVSTQVIGFGAIYAALGFMADPSEKRSWVRLVLAGMAVGVAVMEADHIGALCSLFVAAYAVYQSIFLTKEANPMPAKIGLGVARTSVVAICAALIATNTLTGLVGTQIQGIAGSQQDDQIKAAEWAQKTQWSVPKIEILQVVIPGVFGFRNTWHMYESDQPTDDQYWGTIGMGGGLYRLVGTGFYAGVPVVIIAFWAILQSFRSRGSPFTIMQRRAIWFWTVSMIVAMLLAFGKNAPFYQFFYALPYASTIRNPQKFMHVFSLILVIVFAYGVHGLAVAYMDKSTARVNGWWAQFKNWRANAQSFEKHWFTGCIWAIVISLLGLLLYAASTNSLKDYMTTVGIKADEAPGIASYSVHAVCWFIFFLVASIAVLGLICSGQFSGNRARVGGLLLGALLLVDLGRADAPWIVYWDTNYKYASDSVIDFLAEKPYEHRVSMLPYDFCMKALSQMMPGQQERLDAYSQQLALMQNAYYSAWKQHIFPSRDIQCIDDIQEPRVGVDKQALQRVLPTGFRWWELSNTRYIIGPGTEFIKMLDPTGTKFRAAKTFDLQPKKPNPSTWSVDWKAVENPNGHLAIIEYLEAIPRAKLYSHWEVNTNDDATLQAMAGQAFDPHKSVLLSNVIPPASPANVDKDPGTVVVNPNYRSKRVEMEADVKVPSVLLLADRYSPKWQAEVDGKPVPILRANFIMRGVYLEPGKHTVVMKYVSSMTTLWTSVIVITVGLALWGFLAFSRPEEGSSLPIPAAAPRKDAVKKP